MTEMEKTLILYFAENPKKIVTSRQLSQLFKKSDKTIRKYLKTIQGKIKDYGATLIMRRGEGYLLEIFDRIKFNQMIYSLEQNFSLNIPNEREQYIISRILLENEEVTTDRLMNELYVSRSTILNSINAIKSKIDNYDLKIEIDSQSNIKIYGDELEKRRFLIQSIMTSEHYYQSIISNFSGFIPYESLLIILIEEFRDAKVKISDLVIQNLANHIQLSIKRLIDGFILSDDLVINQIDSSLLEITKRITDRISYIIDTDFPNSEIYFIANYLQSRTNIINDISENENISIRNAIYEALMIVKTTIDFEIDTTLVNNLLQHILPLEARVKQGIILPNPLLSEIKNKYSYEYQVIMDSFNLVDYFKTLSLDENEWGFIVLHILASIERSSHSKLMNVLVICSTGIGSSRMLKSRLEKELSNDINIIEVISYYQLKENNLEGIDLIVSTIDISNRFFNVPVLIVSPLLSESDVEQIRKYINIGNKEKRGENTKRVNINAENEFDYFFDNRRFFVLEQNNLAKDYVIGLLVKSLSESTNELFYQTMIAQINSREKIGSVLFSDICAVPHPAVPIANSSEIAMAYLPNGLDWDNKRVKLIILLSPSKFSAEYFSNIVDKISNFILNEDLILQFTAKPSLYQLKKIFEYL
ncbi:BglG family transcription antiterminator [Tuanshanicoccus lijuaniae]|uniref:BglG family transcription antiterminator n=1 Tax=Aerococcaceae bacterium zg-1292 TaxID=2774330 RepID=UPI00385EB921